jgi:hypothetical protein
MRRRGDFPQRAAEDDQRDSTADQEGALVKTAARIVRPGVGRPRTRGVRLALVALIAVLSTAAAVPGQAGLLPNLAPSCSGQASEQPFTRWLDPAQYVLAPDGAFEGGAQGWLLTGGAGVVSGNETYYVHGATDSHSLALPAGSSATTPPLCLGLTYPTLRMMARNSGSLLSSLRVDVRFTDALGAGRWAPVGVLAAGGAWQPTLPLAVLANLTALPLVTDGTITVSFRFTPQGSAGNWRIDDVYVDPYKGCC